MVKGIEMVNVWRARGGLPHSVESTACLLQIERCDAADEESESGNNERSVSSSSPTRRQRSEMELRMAYSLAIIRAVNGLVDPSQKGLYADSIMSIAAARGLPSWIVELRHDGTHNQLPTLSVLRAASNHLIQWFYSNYWEVQCQHILTCLDPIFETEGGDDSEGDSYGASQFISHDAIEKMMGTCPTGITGPFMARILHCREDCYGGNIGKTFDSAVFKSMCRMKYTTVIDTIIARVVKHALDQADLMGALDEGETGDGVLAALNECRDILMLAQEPWREMHEDLLGAHKEEGEPSLSAKEALHDRRTPARLLHLYWNSLLVRANSTLACLEMKPSSPGKIGSLIKEPLQFICETFRGLNAILARYGEREGGAPESSSSSSSSSTQNKRKRDIEASSYSPEAPSNWTVFNPDGAMAWPLGLDPKSL